MRNANRGAKALSAVVALLVVGGVARADAEEPGIYVMNSDGSGRVQLTSTRFGDLQPAWSPDGTKIAFSHEGAISVMNADGSDPHAVTAPAAGYDMVPAWSPDGNTIAFARYSGQPSGVFVVNADGSGERNLASTSGLDGDPAWSPDGTKIAFDSNRTGVVDIYVMNADGSDQRPIAASPLGGSEPAWSPDGTTIAFSKWVGPPTYDYDIALIGVDGTGERRITNDVNFDYSPSWSPDGKKIAFGRASSGIFVVDADGTDLHQLPTAPNDEQPAWSPSGTKIALDFRPPPPPPGPGPPGPPPPPPPAPAPPPPRAVRCIVPRVVLLRLGAARRKIQKAHCSVGRIRRQRARRWVDHVVAQKPRAHTRHRRGFRVSLVVGRR